MSVPQSCRSAAADIRERSAHRAAFAVPNIDGLRSWQDTPLGNRQRRDWHRLGAPGKTFELAIGDDAQVVGTVVAGNPVPARSRPTTTTMSRPATFATGVAAASGWTAVIGTPSSEATSA